ncbi:hypothetical protein [Actibacterium sp. D379-3]
MSSYHMELASAGQTASLRIEITDLPGKETWMCNKPDFLGMPKGEVAWKGRTLGLFSPGSMEFDPKEGYNILKPGVIALGILEIPAIGLDEVRIGEGDAVRFEHRPPGIWTLKHRKTG